MYLVGKFLWLMVDIDLITEYLTDLIIQCSGFFIWSFLSFVPFELWAFSVALFAYSSDLDKIFI